MPIRRADAKPEEALDPARCLHCGLAVPRPARDPRFCCAGCAVVFGLLHGTGLTRFYALGGGKGQPVGPVPEPARRDWLPELEQAGALAQGKVRLALDVQGIHCAACVWLIEALARRHEGLLRIEINPSRGQMLLLYDRERLALDTFLDQVERFGYRVGPASKEAARESRALLMRMGVCIALALNAMMFALASYLGMTPADGPAYPLFRGLSLALATLAVLIGGPVFFRGALAGLRQRVLHLDLPIALGLALAYGSSVAWFLSGAEGYFDTVTTFVALMLVGRYVQQRALQRNRDYLLRNDGAEHLRVRRRRDDQIDVVPVRTVAAGDRLWLVPGDLVPVPVRLAGRAASFSLDWISGESAPRAFGAKDEVPAGAFLADRRPVEVIAAASAADSPLLHQLAAPGPGRDGQAPLDRFWQSLSRRWVAMVLLASGLAGALWLSIDPSRALGVVAAMLVVTCPCALGIAVPLAFDLAVGELRRRGIWVRSLSLLERARHVRKVLFDKTGTLTWGGLRVHVLRPVPGELRDVLLTMVTSSNHPCSRAIAHELGAGGFRFVDGLDVEEIPGQGLRAVFAGQELRLGSARHVFGEPRAKDQDGLCLLARAGKVEACFQLEEDVREGFGAEISALAARGYEVWLLSGDRRERTARVAATLGIAAERALGDLSPQSKADVVAGLDRGDTLMVGDGLNDAPAFGAATCAGTPAIDRPVLPSKADFFFTGGGAFAVSAVLEQSLRLRSVVRTNLGLSLAYNSIAIGLCTAGLMTPLLCAVLMPLSSLATIAHTVWRLRTRDAAGAGAQQRGSTGRQTPAGVAA